MGCLTINVLDRLSQGGPRLPCMAAWLMEEVWSDANYQAKSPADYLQAGEKAVNELEEVIAAAAGRIYDEMLQPVPTARNLREFLLTAQPCAAIVFDGLSLREVPLIRRLSAESGLRIVEEGWSVASVPSETVDFIAGRLGVGAIGPSQLPGSGQLKSLGVSAVWLDQVNQKRLLDSDAPAILVWSAFPDYRYKERDARFAEMFEHLQNMMMTAWQNSVQEVVQHAPGRRILVTSDHGYVFFGSGCSFPWDNAEISPLTEYLGGERFSRLAEKPDPPQHRGLAVLKDRGVAMIRGRVQTHPRGEGARKLYKHGGMSLMEMLVPWLVLEQDR
ncbi:MAG TPA: hypothetical protein VNA25_16145 [Phycisphaerae bacterium]|nr:hypothetical protein [Phycisphaerae bacterium]